MSASNQYKSTTNSSYDSCYGDEENYANYSRALKEEDDQIYITEETNDSFNEKRGLIGTNFSLQNHEQAYQVQQQKLFAIKNLIDPSSSDQQNQLFRSGETNTHQHSGLLHNNNQNSCNGSSLSSNLNQQKSKKEILKEKCEKKKQQILEKKIASNEETNSDQSNMNEKKKVTLQNKFINLILFSLVVQCDLQFFEALKKNGIQIWVAVKE